MHSKKATDKYIIFLRGINVGGHHKVPMADLRKELEKLGFNNVMTLLNSGNVLFDANSAPTEELEKIISEHLEKFFGFSIPTIIRTSEMINQLLNTNPFEDITITKDIRLYVSFLKKDDNIKLKLPWKSPDNSYQIIEKRNSTILSVLDLSVSNTLNAMEALEKNYGKDITTRNWKTIERIGTKLSAATNK